MLKRRWYKSIVNLFACFLMIFMHSTSLANIVRASGDDEIEISNFDQLKNFATKVNSGEYVNKNAKLINDIDCSAALFEGWIPIGTTSNQYHGTFDGDNHAILNLTRNDDNNWSNVNRQEFVGLFGIAGNGSTIKNLKIKDSSFTVNVDSGSIIGTIAAKSSGKIENCSVENCNLACATVGGLEQKYYTVGGIVGESDGTVSKCTFSGGTVSNKLGKENKIGGIVGKATGDKIEDCIFSGKVEGGDINSSFYPAVFSPYIGGICGYSSASISNCKVENGDISACAKEKENSESYGGGIVGYITNANISNCSFSGKLNTKSASQNGPSYVGGICGLSDQSSVENCNSDADVSFSVGSDIFIGGIVGHITNADTSDCSFSGNLASSAYKVNTVGGICGYASGNITECENNGTIINDRGNNRENDNSENILGGTGGIVGETKGNVNKCINLGQIKCGNNNEYVNCGIIGGVAGKISSGATINECYNGSYLDENSGDIEISNINNYYYIGGIVGQNDSSTVINCINNGNFKFTDSTVSFKKVVGGIVGYVGGSGSTPLVFNCRNSGIFSLSNPLTISLGGCIGRVSSKTNIGNLSNTVKMDKSEIPIQFSQSSVASIVNGDNYMIDVIAPSYYNSENVDISPIYSNNEELTIFDGSYFDMSEEKMKSSSDDSLLGKLNAYISVDNNVMPLDNNVTPPLNPINGFLSLEISAIPWILNSSLDPYPIFDSYPGNDSSYGSSSNLDYGSEDYVNSSENIEESESAKDENYSNSSESDYNNPSDDEYDSKIIAGIPHRIYEDGKTSVEVDKDGIIWLKEESDGTSAWYGLNNSDGVFEKGSRFWVRWLSKSSPDWQEYYDMLDDEHKKKVEENKLWIFLTGVTKPDGSEYEKLSKSINYYIQLGQDWDKGDLNALFIIPNNKDEKLEVTYTDMSYPNDELDIYLDYGFYAPDKTGEFAKVILEHFSPYAIYDQDKKEQTLVLSPFSNLVYNGSEQQLVVKPENVDGTVYFRVNGGEWSTELPSATEAGSYDVEVYVEGNDEYSSIGSQESPAQKINVVIQKTSQPNDGENIEINNKSISFSYPETLDLDYNGNMQNLIVPAINYENIGTVWYRFQKKGTKNFSEWSTDIPKAKDVGSYNVQFYIQGKDNYLDFPSNGSSNHAPTSSDNGYSIGVSTISALSQNGSYPTSKSLIYNGKKQELINPATGFNGTVYYRVDGGQWSTAIPTGIEQKTYKVEMYVKGNEGYKDLGSEKYPAYSTSVEIMGLSGLSQPEDGSTKTIDGRTITFKHPQTVELTYNGKLQNLVIPAQGYGATGIVYYSFKKSNETNFSEWSTDIPKASAVGNYDIRFYIQGTGDYSNYYSELLGTSVILAKDQKGTPPKAIENLIKDGTEKELITPATGYNGTVYYRVNNGPWSTEIPTSDSWINTVEYYVDGNVGYNDLGSYDSPAGKILVKMQNWGEHKKIAGIDHWVDYSGMTSVQVNDNGIIWLKEESDGTYAWYGLDNSDGHFEKGSRFWVRWLSEKDEEWKEYYGKLDEKHKLLAEDGKLWIFLTGVTAPDGTEYEMFVDKNGNKFNVPYYIQLGSDWDQDDINAVYIVGSGTDEVLNVTYTYMDYPNDNLDIYNAPDQNGLFAKITLEHFSPYAVYDKSSSYSLSGSYSSNGNVYLNSASYENNAEKSASVNEGELQQLEFIITTMLMSALMFISIRKRKKIS